MNTYLYYDKTRYLEKNGFRRKGSWSRGKIHLENSYLTNDSVTFDQFVIDLEIKRASLEPILGFDIFDDTISELRKRKVHFLKDKGFVLIYSNQSRYMYQFAKVYSGTNAKDIIHDWYLEDSYSWDDFLMGVDRSATLRAQDVGRELNQQRAERFGYGPKSKETKGPDAMAMRLPGSYGSSKGY